MSRYKKEKKKTNKWAKLELKNKKERVENSYFLFLIFIQIYEI